MIEVCTKLYELTNVLDITQEKLESKSISIEDAYCVLQIVNSYLDVLEV